MEASLVGGTIDGDASLVGAVGDSTTSAMAVDIFGLFALWLVLLVLPSSGWSRKGLSIMMISSSSGADGSECGSALLELLASS